MVPYSTLYSGGLVCGMEMYGAILTTFLAQSSAL